MGPVVWFAALTYAFLSAIVAVFQTALALGAPWGTYAMGGSFPGQLPGSARIAALVQAALIVFTAAVVASRAGLVLPGLAMASSWLVWVVVGLLALSLVGNLLSPSAGERILWVPVLIIMLTTSMLVGVGSR